MTIALARQRTASVLLNLADGLPSLSAEEREILYTVSSHAGKVSPETRAAFYALFMIELFGADLAAKSGSIQNDINTATNNPGAIAAPAAIPLRSVVDYVNYQFQWGIE